MSLEIICLLHCRKMWSFCVCGKGSGGRNALDISAMLPDSTITIFRMRDGLVLSGHPGVRVWKAET